MRTIIVPVAKSQAEEPSSSSALHSWKYNLKTHLGFTCTTWQLWEASLHTLQCPPTSPRPYVENHETTLHFVSLPFPSIIPGPPLPVLPVISW